MKIPSGLSQPGSLILPHNVSFGTNASEGVRIGLRQSIEQWAGWDKTEGASFRWHPESMPLTICLDAPSLESGWTQEPEQLLNLAIKQWELASRGALRFQQCFSPDSAHIRIQWNETPTPGREFELGHAERNVQGSWIWQVCITLVTQPAIDGHLSAARRKERLYSTLLHELGHALGLEHSVCERDVMHHRGWRNRYLSENDCRRLQALYQSHQGYVF